MPEHVSAVLSRALSRVQCPRLAPLEPDAFLAWIYAVSPECHIEGSGPLTLNDVWFEWARHGDGVTMEEIRRMYVRLAALVRRNQRLGRDPFEAVDYGRAPIPRRY